MAYGSSPGSGKGGNYGNSPGEGGGKFGGSGLGGSAGPGRGSSPGGKTSGGGTSKSSGGTSKSGGVSKSGGDTGRYGGGTKGTTGQGFGGKAGSQYSGGSKSTASQSKGSNTGNYGNYSGDTGRFGGGTKGTTGQGFGGKAGAQYSGARTTGGGAGPGRGVSPGGPTTQAGRTAAAAGAESTVANRMGTPTTIGAGRGLSPGGPMTAAARQEANLSARFGPSTVVSANISPERFGPTTAPRTRGFNAAADLDPSIVAGISAESYRSQPPTFGETVRAQAARTLERETMDAYNRAVADTTTNARRADLAQQGRTLENQTMDAYSRAVQSTTENARRADLAQQRRASETYSQALGDFDKEALAGSYRDAIAGRETEGVADPYGSKHADVKRKDGSITNAYGKYGIMEDNIGPWSQQVLGRTVSLAEFRASPEIQDAIFDGVFGGYVDKYGSFEKAAQAWYGGPGAVGKPSRGPRPGNPGPTVGEYAADAVGRQINAYNARSQPRSQIAQTSTGVTGVPGTATQTAAASPGVTASVANREQTANRAAHAAFNAAVAEAESQGLDPNDPTVAAAIEAKTYAAYNESFNAEQAAAAQPAPAPAVTTETTETVTRTAPAPQVNLPQRAPKPPSREPLPPRGFGSLLAAGAIDILMGTNPVSLAANIASLLATGQTVGGAVVGAARGEYGENYYNPGETPERNQGGAGAESGRDYNEGVSTQTPQSAAESEEATDASYELPADTFEVKYLGGPVNRPSPEEKWDWKSSKYVGVV